MLLALGFCLLIFLRLFQVQVINKNKYIEQAKRQYLYQEKLQSRRGIIYDRNMEPLAVNRKAISIGVDVNNVSNSDSMANFLSDILGESRDFFLNKFTSTKHFFWADRIVDGKIAKLHDFTNVPGVTKIKESIRFYPRNSLASHVVGFTNIDLMGLSGIEKAKNIDLQGNNGLALYNRDAYGRKIIDVEQPVRKPQKGKNIVLTIDNTYQWICEGELKYAVEKFDAEAGVVIIANPKTGEILSMAVNPDFNLNEARHIVPAKRRNRAITDVYEPGSTFKSIVMAAVLETGFKKPTDIVFCENGRYKIYGETVSDAVPYQWLSLQKIIKKSSNIGMAKIAKDMDKRKIYKYVRDFGFGLETGIGLPGEVSGDLKHYVEWSNFSPIAMSYGYEVSVTPLQMVMAYSAIANGGLLLKPKISLGSFNKLNRKVKTVKPKVIRRVISDSTATILKGMLEEVVFDGTGKKAFINGLRIAGKTGTAMKYIPKLKDYSSDQFISSFIGFFPVESPDLLIYVMIDNPRNDHLGGKVAAPTFKRILQRILRYVDINPQYRNRWADNNNESGPIIPDLKNKRVEDAKQIAEHAGLELVVKNQGDLVSSQKLILNHQKGAKPQLIVTLKEFKSNSEDYTKVPSVVGMSLREAISKISQSNLKAFVNGSGRVISQIPDAGTKMRSGARCVIQCKPAVDLTEFHVL